MIIGNGQLAQSVEKIDEDAICFFASGVANSNCTDAREFQRERDLLLKHLQQSQDKKFVYFSSCALSAKEYELNDYYKHKQNMEKLIHENSNNYYIFRIPQLFGKLTKHPTLINFIYNAIVNDIEFTVFDEAYRYVIEISDVKKIVEAYLNNANSCITVDVANPYRYKVIEIVEIMEKLLKKKAIYKTVNKVDFYDLDISLLLEFVEEYSIGIEFGKDYLTNKLK